MKLLFKILLIGVTLLGFKTVLSFSDNSKIDLIYTSSIYNTEFSPEHKVINQSTDYPSGELLIEEIIEETDDFEKDKLKNKTLFNCYTKIDTNKSELLLVNFISICVKHNQIRQIHILLFKLFHSWKLNFI